MINSTTGLSIENLSNMIKSNLIAFYGKPLNSEVIESITLLIIETINDFIKATGELDV